MINIISRRNIFKKASSLFLAGFLSQAAFAQETDVIVYEGVGFSFVSLGESRDQIDANLDFSLIDCRGDFNNQCQYQFGSYRFGVTYDSADTAVELSIRPQFKRNDLDNFFSVPLRQGGDIVTSKGVEIEEFLSDPQRAIATYPESISTVYSVGAIEAFYDRGAGIEVFRRIGNSKSLGNPTTAEIKIFSPEVADTREPLELGVNVPRRFRATFTSEEYLILAESGSEFFEIVF